MPKGTICATLRLARWIERATSSEFSGLQQSEQGTEVWFPARDHNVNTSALRLAMMNTRREEATHA